MRDIHEIRLQNLGFLIQECEAEIGRKHGAVQRLATLSGVRASLLSMLVNGAVHSDSGKRRQIGDSTANKLEDGMGKDPGWMDVDRSQARDFREAALLDKLRRITAAQRNAIEHMLEAFQPASAPPDRPKPPDDQQAEPPPG